MSNSLMRIRHFFIIFIIKRETRYWLSPEKGTAKKQKEEVEEVILMTTDKTALGFIVKFSIYSIILNKIDKNELYI